LGFEKDIIVLDGEAMQPLLNYENAVIPIEKFTQYVLDPIRSREKAIMFERALGYTVRNADKLVENIRKHLGDYNAKKKGDIGYGMTYEVVMELTDENGKKAHVLTAWISDAATGETRLTSAYIKKLKEEAKCLIFTKPSA